MTAYTFTSHEFNKHVGGAMKAANDGPVCITDRGMPSHVLLSYDDYLRLTANQPSIVEMLGKPDGIEDVDFEVPIPIDTATPAALD